MIQSRIAPTMPVAGAIIDVAIDHIEPSPLNVRTYFDQEALDELAASIAAVGIVSPLWVRPLGVTDPVRYQLVAGERRLRAARQLGLTSVPVRVFDQIDDRQALVLSLVENCQRADLDPIEEARGYAALRDLGGMPQIEIASAVGRSQSRISRILGVLTLPADVQELVRSGALSLAHAEVLLPLLAFPTAISAIAHAAVEHRLSSRMLLTKAARVGNIPVIRALADAWFDTRVCEECPFGALHERHCLNPAHFDELQEANARAADHATARTSPPRRNQSRSAAGAGATQPAAPHPITDPDAEAVQRTRRVGFDQYRQVVAARLAALDRLSARDVAPITAYVLAEQSSELVRRLAAQYAPSLHVQDGHPVGRRARLEALRAVPAQHQVRLILAVLLENDIAFAALSEHARPTLTEWYLTTGAPQKGPAQKGRAS